MNKYDKVNQNEEFIYTTLDELTPILTESGYISIGHGTGRSGNSDDVIESIFKEGLRTKDNSLYYTSIVLSTPTPELIKQYEEFGLSKPTMQKLQEQLNNWQHQDSKKIIIGRLPIEYINTLGNQSDLDGEMYGAFMNIKNNEDGKPIYYLDPKFIIGSYDVNTGLIKLNKSFESTLTNETRNELREKYLKILEKTKRRIESSEIIQNPTVSNETSTYDLSNYDFDEDIEWDIEETNNSKSI